MVGTIVNIIIMTTAFVLVVGAFTSDDLMAKVIGG